MSDEEAARAKATTLLEELIGPPHKSVIVAGDHPGLVDHLAKHILEASRERFALAAAIRVAVAAITGLEKERDAALALLNTPEVLDFVRAVQLEAAHQRKRWPSEHDAGKTDADWFWLIGYLAGKALHNPGPHDRDAVAFHAHEDPVTTEPLYFTPYDCTRDGCPDRAATPEARKQLHRIVTVAAAAANWHAARLGQTNMRPGIETPAGET